MPEYMIVTYTRCVADDDADALAAALDVLVRSYDRIVIKHGSVALRDYERSSGRQRINQGASARSVRKRLADA